MKTPILKGSVELRTDAFRNKIVLCSVDTSICSYDCLGCSSYIKYYPDVYLSRDRLVQKLINMKLKGYDLLVITGGEPLFYKKSLVALLPELRLILPVRIETNGFRPFIVTELRNLVDGFGVDIKVPLKDSYTSEEKKRYQAILGERADIYTYRNSVRQTIKIVDGMEYTVFTTLRYPLFVEDDLRWMERMFSTLKSDSLINDWIPPKELNDK